MTFDFIVRTVLTVMILAVVLSIILTNIRIVPQAHCYIVERLGVYHTTWQAGLRFKIPFIDRVASRISLKEQVLDFPPQSVITKDNVTMNIDSVVYARVFDPKKYTYGVENPIVGLQNLTATTLRSVIGEMDLDETLSSREQINAKMRVILDEATDEWGIQVTRVEVKNITPPREIEEVMTKQMRAERERRQTVLEAQAHQESVVARAKGDKEAKVLAAEAERDAKIAMAEGQAQAIRKVYEAEASGLRLLADSGLDPEIMVRLKSIDAMKDIADGQATKVFVPNDIASSLSAFGSIGEVLETAHDVKKGVKREQFQAEREEKRAREKVAEDPCIEEGVSDETISSALANARFSNQEK